MMLTVKNLTVSVGQKKIIHDFSFNFEANKVYALMGPNGSGKSSLVLSLMGHPIFSTNRDSKLIFNNQNIKKLSPEKRAKLGFFLSFQSPLSLAGVTVFQLLRLATRGKESDVLKLKKKVEDAAGRLRLKPELLERSLNEGFSGGERKKMEVLQVAILDPQFLIFDEIDTGVDVDSLKTIASFLRGFRRQGKTLLLITHYNRLLKYIKPDQVLVLVDGRLRRSGDSRLAGQIEKHGYENL